jgi:hypothetical protein
MAKRESDRRSERIKIGLAARKVVGKAVGRQPGAADKKPPKHSGYVARWERDRILEDLLVCLARRAFHGLRDVRQWPGGEGSSGITPTGFSPTGLVTPVP